MTATAAPTRIKTALQEKFEKEVLPKVKEKFGITNPMALPRLEKVVINTGNAESRVLTLALSVLGGRAADSPNLVLAGASIAILPPLFIYILGQRFFVESSTSSGVKG